MKPTLINIKERAKNPEYYDRTRDMETALAYNSIKKALIEGKQEILFEYIQSVRLTEKYIVISTGKPLINTELKGYNEGIITSFNATIGAFGGKKRERIRTQ